MAVRGGFEPRCTFAHTRFPGVLLQPLGHLTVLKCVKYKDLSKISQVFELEHKNPFPFS